MEAYTDADYVGSLIDRRFTSVYCIFLCEIVGVQHIIEAPYIVT